MSSFKPDTRAEKRQAEIEAAILRLLQEHPEGLKQADLIRRVVKHCQTQWSKAHQRLASLKDRGHVRSLRIEPHAEPVLSLPLFPAQLEPKGGNLYKPHAVMITSGEFWRCAHGTTGFDARLNFVGCLQCAGADPEAYQKWTAGDVAAPASTDSADANQFNEILFQHARKLVIGLTPWLPLEQVLEGIETTQWPEWAQTRFAIACRALTDFRKATDHLKGP